jgi:hypothetical protein
LGGRGLEARKILAGRDHLLKELLAKKAGVFKVASMGL